ncbi:MAG: hypothetical protein MSC50_06115 [Campylobacter sp.]|uniref:hypothetical protein n=1 Tax=Campylobacter sp. TaxID=205 RepID=UPI002AA6A182|nr:hypothetical protein [Campylobacter sp.]MCI6579830.1 hypothetical protein [Campylobacter sp.]
MKARLCFGAGLVRLIRTRLLLLNFRCDAKIAILSSFILIILLDKKHPPTES